MQVVLGLVLLAIAYVGLFVMVEKIGRMAIKHTAPYTAAIIVASLAIGWAGWGSFWTIHSKASWLRLEVSS
jgi:hypothetical protein